MNFDVALACTIFAINVQDCAWNKNLLMVCTIFVINVQDCTWNKHLLGQLQKKVFGILSQKPNNSKIVGL